MSNDIIPWDHQERMAKRILSKSIPEPNSGCWLWIAYVDQKGYGRLSTNVRTKPERAHRLSYQVFKGPIENKKHVLHKCDTPSCVNPEHLFLGTSFDNMRDMSEKNRHSQRHKTHCPKGHLYSGLNERGARVCQTCRREQALASYHRRKSYV
jgi:hypothetical protein